MPVLEGQVFLQIALVFGLIGLLGLVLRWTFHRDPAQPPRRLTPKLPPDDVLMSGPALAGAARSDATLPDPVTLSSDAKAADAKAPDAALADKTLADTALAETGTAASGTASANPGQPSPTAASPTAASPAAGSPPKANPAQAGTAPANPGKANPAQAGTAPGKRRRGQRRREDANADSQVSADGQGVTARDKGRGAQPDARPVSTPTEPSTRPGRSKGKDLDATSGRPGSRDADPGSVARLVSAAPSAAPAREDDFGLLAVAAEVGTAEEATKVRQVLTVAGIRSTVGVSSTGRRKVLVFGEDLMRARRVAGGAHGPGTNAKDAA